MYCFQKRLPSRFRFDVVPLFVPLSNAVLAVVTGSRSKHRRQEFYEMKASAMTLGLANKLSVGDSKQASVTEDVGLTLRSLTTD